MALFNDLQRKFRSGLDVIKNPRLPDPVELPNDLATRGQDLLRSRQIQQEQPRISQNMARAIAEEERLQQVLADKGPMGLIGKPAEASNLKPLFDPGMLNQPFTPESTPAVKPEPKTLAVVKTGSEVVPPREQPKKTAPKKARVAGVKLNTKGQVENPAKTLGLNLSERKLFESESHFRPNAKNPTSSAFGIGQMIKSQRDFWGNFVGVDPNTTDPHEQIQMARAYIKNRYGTAKRAWQFKQATVRQDPSLAPEDLRGVAEFWIGKGYKGY